MTKCRLIHDKASARGARPVLYKPDTMMENTLATVDFICVDAVHIARGREIPDGYGALKLNGRRWAYCSAALPHEPHRWEETGGVAFDAILHSQLPAVQDRGR
jgi:hypothetical protein